jgi:hypothetical protein
MFLWGALSDERTGLSFVYVSGPCQRSLSSVRVPSDSPPYCTVMAVLVGELTNSATQFHRLLFPTTPSVLQSLRYKQFSHTTVLVIALSRATPIPVLSRTLGAFDCRLISFARRLAAD